MEFNNKQQLLFTRHSNDHVPIGNALNSSMNDAYYLLLPIIIYMGAVVFAIRFF